MTMDVLCCEVKAKLKSYIKTNLSALSPRARHLVSECTTDAATSIYNILILPKCSKKKTSLGLKNYEGALLNQHKFSLNSSEINEQFIQNLERLVNGRFCCCCWKRLFLLFFMLKIILWIYFFLSTRLCEYFY